MRNPERPVHGGTEGAGQASGGASPGDAANSEAPRDPRAASSPGDAASAEAPRDPRPASSPYDAATSETKPPLAEPVTAAAAPAPIDPTSSTAILDTLARELPPETLDELWIFPPRRIGPGQSTIVVASVLDPDPESDRRRIFTARFTLVRDRKGRAELRQETSEEGAAPAELVARVVDGVVRRLEDEPAPPRYARIAGIAAAWAELRASVSQAET